MTAAYVDFSEVFEVLDQLILQVHHDVLGFRVLRKFSEGNINPLENILPQIYVKLVDLVGVDKVAPSLKQEDSEVDHLSLSQRHVPREFLDIVFIESLRLKSIYHILLIDLAIGFGIFCRGVLH